MAGRAHEKTSISGRAGRSEIGLVHRRSSSRRQEDRARSMRARCSGRGIRSVTVLPVRPASARSRSRASAARPPRDTPAGDDSWTLDARRNTEATDAIQLNDRRRASRRAAAPRISPRSSVLRPASQCAWHAGFDRPTKQGEASGRHDRWGRCNVDCPCANHIYAPCAAARCIATVYRARLRVGSGVRRDDGQGSETTPARRARSRRAAKMPIWRAILGRCAGRRGRRELSPGVPSDKLNVNARLKSDLRKTRGFVRGRGPSQQHVGRTSRATLQPKFPL